MKKILVPYDGSDFSMRALSWAIEHRSAAEDEIHLIYVETTPQTWQTHGMEKQAIESQLRHHAKNILAPARDTLKTQNIPYHSHEEIGDPPRNIAALASELSCDQIVMGSHGHNAFLDLVMGSVALKVLRLTKIPVTLIR